MDKREIQSKRFNQSLEERGLTVIEVAEATGIDLGTLMTLEKGYTKRLTLGQHRSLQSSSVEEACL